MTLASWATWIYLGQHRSVRLGHACPGGLRWTEATSWQLTPDHHVYPRLSSSLSLSRSPSFNIPLPSGPALSYLTPAHPALWFELLSQPQIICTLHTLCFSHILSCLRGYVSQTDFKWTVTHAVQLILDKIHSAFRLVTFLDVFMLL